MITYTDKLKILNSGNKLLQFENSIYTILWRKFHVKLPPVLYAPLVLNFFSIFTLVSAIILLMYLGVLIIDYLVFDLFFYYNGFSHIKLFGGIEILTILLLLFLEASKVDKNCNRWYSDVGENSIIWRFECGEKQIWSDTQMQWFIAGFLLIFAITYIYLFGFEFIKFVSNVLGIIVIYQTINILWFYYSLRKWEKVSINTISFSVQENDIVDGSLNDLKYKKYYMLSADYSYKYHNSIYRSAQIFADEAERATLFNSPDKFYIKEWINKNANIRSVYVNPNKHYQAVLVSDILVRSYIGKYILILAIGFVLFIINTLL